MTTALFTHPDALGHVTPPGHPERVARLQAILVVLDDDRFAALDRHEPPLAEETSLLRCHPASYVARVERAAPERGWMSLDADTHVSPGSPLAARRAAGAAIAAVDAVLTGVAANAFSAMRPPGHHAERQRAMGFCLFGNVALAAKHALDHHGLAKVAVCDFDVHHGNGTQDLLWDEERVAFVSLHQSPLYPGSGAPGERGAHGQILNLPLPPGTDGDGFREVFDGQAMPFLEAAEPQLVIVSAGFDAAAADPLANMELEAEDFAWATERLCDLADVHAEGRLVSCLEGGYDLGALAAGVAAHVEVLMRRGGAAR